MLNSVPSEAGNLGGLPHTSRSSHSWREALRDLGVLAIFPLLLAWLDANWAFTSSQVGLIDPWLYTSRFLHLKAQALALPYGYYGDRISYTIPGWLLYQVFGAFTGNYVLKLLQIYLAIGGLYFLAKVLFNRRTAFLCAALMRVHPYFLMVFGWDYVSGSGIV